MFIPRTLAAAVAARLRQFPAVALVGPRQVGKTTLARLLADAVDSVYLDLEDPADLAKLEDAGGYLRMRRRRLVVIDEVQRASRLFPLLRVVIDERNRAGEAAGQILLLGSAAPDLQRQSGESLAGRIAYLELPPLDVRETGYDLASRLWVRGGFPPSFLASSDSQSAEWREQFIRTYLERDVPQLGPRVPPGTLRRLWTMLAHSQGSLLNVAALARSLAIDGKTVTRYVDLLADLFLVRRLIPFHANVRKRLVKAPKVYVRDSGLVHTLLRLDTLDGVLGHPVAGASWEGFVLETLIRAAPERAQASFYRTATGVEVDLVLELPDRRLWAIEIKRGSAPTVDKGLRIAFGDLQPERMFLVHSGEQRYPKGDGIEAIGLMELAQTLAQLDPLGSSTGSREPSAAP